MVTFHSSAVIIICIQDACFGPLETTAAFILKGLSGSASPRQSGFLNIVDKKFPILEFIKFDFIHGIKLRDWFFVFPGAVTTRQQANYDGWL